MTPRVCYWVVNLSNVHNLFPTCSSYQAFPFLGLPTYCLAVLWWRQPVQLVYAFTNDVAKLRAAAAAAAVGLWSSQVCFRLC